MSVSLVQKTQNATTATATTLIVPWPAATTLGNHLVLVVAVSLGSGVTLTTPTGWTKVSEANNSTNVKVAVFFIENAASRSSETIAVSSTATINAAMAEYSGVLASGSLDVSASNTGSSAAPDSGTTAATAQANELIVALTAGFASGVFGNQSSPTNSFTIEEAGQGGFSSHVDIAFSDRVVSATGTYDVSTTAATSYPWAGMIATFKAAAAPVARRRVCPAFLL